MNGKRWWALGMIFILLWTGNGGLAQAEELDPSRLYAKSAVLMDGHSGRILYEKNGYEILPMASTTKIMTCILALELGDPEQWFSVSSYASSMPQVRLGVQRGERYRLKDLLYSLMLESHNDVAVVIAEGIAGSVEAFAGLMNQKARDLGAFDTFFVTPNGLDATALCLTETGESREMTHSTTAADLARILRYCIRESSKREEFLYITREDSYQFCDADEKRMFYCYNHNLFLDMMEGALTGKTGYTGQAGYCYVGAVERGEKLYIVALLACGWPNHKTYKWTDMRTLTEYGLEQYEYEWLWQEIPKQRIPVWDGETEDGNPDSVAYVELIPDPQTWDPKQKILLRQGEVVRMEVMVAEGIQAPVEAGTTAGSIACFLGEDRIEYIDLVTAEAVIQRDFCWYLDYVCRRFLGTDVSLF